MSQDVIMCCYFTLSCDILYTCFITNNDITGGNSGSPVINGEGEWIGAAFDGNWEAMSGDISFDKNYKRTIVVDGRYVLWIIEKLGKADNLIKEMDIRYLEMRKAQSRLLCAFLLMLSTAL